MPNIHLHVSIHTLHVLLGLGYLTHDVNLKFIYLPEKIMVSLFFIA